MFKYSYQTMPKDTTIIEGMKVVKGDTSNLRATIKQDQLYITKDNKDLHLRILRPESINKETDQTKYPLLVHVQGSAYMKQNLNDHVMDLKEIVTSGFVVAIVEYRESSIAKMPAQVDDVFDALHYIHENYETLQVDENRIYLSGDSSGGHAALMCWAQLPTKEKDYYPNIRGVMDFYGAVDLLDLLNHESAIDHSGTQSAEGIALGGAPEDPNMIERIKETSVLTYIKKDLENVPLLVLHGNKDRLVPFGQSVLLYNACKEANKNIEFYCVEDADHGGSAFYCKAVYDIILNFLHTK